MDTKQKLEALLREYLQLNAITQQAFKRDMQESGIVPAISRHLRQLAHYEVHALEAEKFLAGMEAVDSEPFEDRFLSYIEAERKRFKFRIASTTNRMTNIITDAQAEAQWDMTTDDPLRPSMYFRIEQIINDAKKTA